ncbi:MAG: hypothetical protein ACK4OK_03890 [Thermoflexus sp.]
MRILRWIGVILFGLSGGVLALMSFGGAFATYQQGYEAPWIFLVLLLPLAAVLLGTSWALGARRRVRRVAGILLAIAAFVYTLLLAWSTVVLVISAAGFPSLFPRNVLTYLLIFWIFWPVSGPVVVLSTVLAGVLLWKQGVRLAPYLFAGIALSLLIGWAGHWIFFIILELISKLSM